jgi:hypothetical protein
MGLQAGLWAEITVSVHIKPELSSRVGTHQFYSYNEKSCFSINQQEIIFIYTEKLNRFP